MREGTVKRYLGSFEEGEYDVRFDPLDGFVRDILGNKVFIGDFVLVNQQSFLSFGIVTKFKFDPNWIKITVVQPKIKNALTMYSGKRWGTDFIKIKDLDVLKYAMGEIDLQTFYNLIDNKND